MKIALCIFGQPRFLNNINIKKSLDYHLYNQGDVDVFTHFWFDGNLTSFNGSEWNKVNYIQNEDAVKIIYDTYKPKVMLYEPPVSFNINDVNIGVLSKLRYYTENNLHNLLSHLYSFERSIELISGVYDFVVITRYDNLIINFPNLKQLNGGLFATNYYNNNFSDAIFIVKTEFLKGLKVFSQFNTVINSISVMTSECVKKEVFLNTFDNSNIKYVDLVAGIVRDDNDIKGIL